MAADSMQAHLLRLQEIMAQSAAASAPKPQDTVPVQQPARPQHKPIVMPVYTEWRPALKYVTRFVAQNPDIESSIRKMITEHRLHEQQWWQERQKTTAESDLKAYDMKVYKAQKSMQEHMARHLHTLGIPFFAPTQNNMSREEILELQRRMLEHLESAYGPD